MVWNEPFHSECTPYRDHIFHEKNQVRVGGQRVFLLHGVFTKSTELNRNLVLNEYIPFMKKGGIVSNQDYFRESRWSLPLPVSSSAEWVFLPSDSI